MKNWTDKRDDIIATPLPASSGRYGVIPHSVFLDEIREELDKKHYTIAEERYLTASNNQVLSGFFRIQNHTDIEIMPSVHFVNSYNKTRKASIRVTATVLVCKNGMMASTVKGSYVRKHIGTRALSDFRAHISTSIDTLEDEFARLVKNKEEMKSIGLTKRDRALIVGDMLLNEDLITSTQLSILKEEIKFSEHFKGTSLWDFYNHTTESYKENNPNNFDKQHIKFHSYISDKYSLSGHTGLYGKALEPIALSEV